MEDDTERKSRTKPFSADVIVKLTGQIEHMAARWRQLAQQIEANQYTGTLTVDGGKKAVQGLKFLNSLVSKLETEYSDSIIQSLGVDDSDEPPVVTATKKKAKR